MATHDGRLREALLLALGLSPSSSYSVCDPMFSTNYGTGTSPRRVYVPYGPDWFRYWPAASQSPGAPDLLPR